MTFEEYNKLSPGRTILDVETDEGVKRMIFKFYLCKREEVDGYLLCCTEDLSNPYPDEGKVGDWEVGFECAEVVDMRSKVKNKKD